MKRATYEETAGSGEYRFKDGTGALDPWKTAVNLLGQYEDLFIQLFGERVYWVIYHLWEVPSAVPVTVTRANNGCLDVKWQITDDYAEEIEEVDITELYNSQEEAERVIKAMQQEAIRKEERADGEN
jgi:hypothetical protein